MDSAQTAPSSVRSWRLWALVFAGWTAVGLLGLGQDVLAAVSSGGSWPQVRDVLGTFQSVWLWALMTPPLFAACERFPLDRSGGRRHLAVHVALCLFLWGVDGVVGALLAPVLGRPPMAFVPRLIGTAFICIFSYWALVGLGQALRFHRLYVERRVRASELEAQLLRAQRSAGARGAGRADSPRWVSAGARQVTGWAPG
jgi:hypothetical protein